ncbi:MAG: hypothetical protein ABSB01_11825 [Streptosporangiaceae bacterium]
MPAGPTRRVMLAASAALPLLAVTGCKGVGALGTPPAPAADVGLLKAAIARERLMIARYEAVLGPARADGHAAILEPVLAEHRAHLAQLRSRLIVPAGAAAAAALPASPSATGPGQPAAPGKPVVPAEPVVPASPAAAIAFLRAAEQDASDALLTRLGVAPASLAQLLASISASEATHAAILAAGANAG